MTDLKLVLALLAVVAFLATVGRRYSIPDPISFALGGIALALIPAMPQVALSPEMVLVVFLPPLIYAAAQDTSWAEVKQNAEPILLLAVGLVLFTMGAVAAAVHALVPEMSWAAAFTLGAIVSPPDAVAAKAVADTMRLPRRLVAVLEGEGLVNDATALVAFKIASGAVVAGSSFRPGQGIAQFTYTALIGIAVGLVVGWIGRFILSRVDEPAAENTIILLLPFAAYLPAEELHASGVLAVLTLALYHSQFGFLSTSHTSRLQSRSLWEMIDFILTGLSFVLMGLQLRAVVQDLSHHRQMHLLVTGVVCFLVVAVRPLWILLVSLANRAVYRLKGKSGNPPPKRSLVIVAWSGMRGVVSLAVALSLPLTTATGQPFPGRSLIIFVTFGVILVTLVGQGLTLPFLIRRLRVGVSESKSQLTEVSAQLHLARLSYDHIDDLQKELNPPAEIVDRVRSFWEGRLEKLNRQREILDGDGELQEDGARLHTLLSEFAGRLINIEETELQRMRDAGEVESPMARGIQQRLDLMRMRGGK